MPATKYEFFVSAVLMTAKIWSQRKEFGWLLTIIEILGISMQIYFLPIKFTLSVSKSAILSKQKFGSSDKPVPADFQN